MAEPIEDRAVMNLRHAAMFSFAMHAGAAMLLPLISTGLMSDGPEDRGRFIEDHRLMWVATWSVWALSALSMLLVFVAFRRAYAGTLMVLHAAVTGALAVLADLTGESMLIGVLPSAVDFDDWEVFLTFERAATMLCAGLANGLYTVAVLLLSMAAAGELPSFARLCACGIAVGGGALTVSAILDLEGGMMIAHIVLFPCLLGWLLGVTRIRPPGAPSPLDGR